ncbi:AraC family transcriptional regulator [Kiritimatiellaeota bacterium B1221]|nr:AraC family transcriptional regulator [Kiritimatiellaeota bacterium B1221]
MNISLLHKKHPLINYSSLHWNWYSGGRPYYNLWICLDGEAEMHLNQHKIEVFPGVGVLLKPEDQVKGVKVSPGLICNIGLHFLPENPEDSLALIAHSSRPVQLQHFLLVRELASYLDFLLFQVHHESQAEENRIGGNLLSIFLRNLKMGPEGPMDRLIRKQAEAMRADPERTRSGQELAAEVGLSFSQFARRFQRLYEMSPHDFLIEQRINKARAQLRESQMTVGEIAESLGYKDVGYFSRQFKQKAGVSPLAFRKRYVEE